MFDQKPVLAANPSTINFQGKVVNSDGTNVTNGSYTFVFRLYDSSDHANISTNCNDNSHCWWQETDTLTVTNGVFQVELGAGCAFTSACSSTHSGINWNTNNALYLTMNFNGDTSGSYHGFMDPLIHLDTVPYAFNADNLGGIAASGFIQNNSGAAQSSASFHIDGTGIADVQLQSPLHDTATSNGALGIGTTNAGVITIGNTTHSTVLFNLVNSSATALQVKNGSGNELLTVDTSANDVVLGKKGTGGINGSLVFNTTNASNTTITISAASTGTSYSLTLPTTGPSTSQCLKTDASTASQLTFGSCGGGGGGTLASDYNSSGTSGNTIALSSSGGGVILQDASSPLASLLTVENNAGTANYLNIGASTIDVGDNTTSKTIHIGGNDSAATETIGVGMNSSGVETITIGNTNSTSSLTLDAGTGGINLAPNGSSNTGVTLKPVSNSTSVFDIQNSGSSPIVNVDSTGSNQNNLVTNPSFEGNSVTGWTGDNGASTPTAVTSATTVPFSGFYSGQIAATAAGHGFKYVTGALTASTAYTLNFYAKVSATSGNVLNFGHVENSGSEDAAGLSLTSQYVSTSGWTRYSFSFKTGGTLTSSDYIYIKQNDATTRSLWLDAVTLQTDTNADTNYREGKVQINGTITSPTILQNASNSTTAFQVQNAAGAQVLTVDTTTTNLVSNSGFEVNSSNWAALGSATIIRDPTQANSGLSSLKVTTTSAAGDGAKYAPGSAWINKNTQYTIVLYAKASGSNFSTFEIGYRLSSGDSENAILTAQTVVTGGWTRYSATFTTNNSFTSDSTAYIYAKNTASSDARSFWIDDIRVEQGANITSFGTGALTVTGTIKSPLYLQNTTNTTNEFLVQNSLAGVLFNVDSLNSQITIDATSTIKRTSSGNLTIDLKDSGTTKLLVTNSGAGTGVVSAKTGYQINGGSATAGHYLRGDGTNYVDSALLYSDLSSYPSGCATGSAITTLAASPTCTGFILNQTGVQTSANFNIDGTGTAGTSFASPTYTGSGLVTLSSGGSSNLQLQAASGIVALNKASAANELRVFENAASPTHYTSITYGNISTDSGNLTVAAAGTTLVGNGTGAITINAGSGAAVNITGHADSTWQVDNSHALTITAAAASTWSTSAGALTLTSAAASTWSTAAGGLTLQGATTLTLQSTGANNILLTPAGTTNTGVLINPAANTTAALAVQNTSSKNILNVDTSGNVVSLGNSGASGVTGLLQFNYTGQTGSISLTPASPSSNSYTLTLPAETGTLATTGDISSYADRLYTTYTATGNCAGNNVQMVFNQTANNAVSCSGTTLLMPSNITKLLVQIKGGGGAGGGTSSASAVKAAPGGGEGGYVQYLLKNVASTCGTSNCYYAVGATAVGTNGQVSGNPSCFGTVPGNIPTCGVGETLYANGGTGGAQATSAAVRVGGAGGSASGGDINLPGSVGGLGTGLASTIISGSGGGHGGGSSLVANGNGNAATAASGGGGGGAAVVVSGNAADLGGNGSNGFATFTLYTGTNGVDQAEWYETQAGIGPGDVVAISGNYLKYQDSKGAWQKIAVLKKASTGANLLGVVSTQPNNTMDDGLKAAAQHPQPIALNGRVPVKVSQENGPIHTGDLLTISSTPGVAMRLTESNQPIIGQALNDFEGTGIGTVTVFVKVQYVGNKTQSLASSNAFLLGIFIAAATVGYGIDKKSNLVKKLLRKSKSAKTV